MRASDQLRMYRGGAVTSEVSTPPRVAPVTAGLLHVNYADQEIALAGTDVYTWGDLGSAGTRTFTQVDTSKDPFYGSFGTNPAVVFDGINDFMVSPVVTLSPYAAITVAMTLELDATISGKMIYESSPDINANPGGFFIFQNVPNQLQLAFKNNVGNASKGIVITSGRHRLIFTMAAAPAPVLFSQVYFDGVSLAGTGVADRGFGDFAHYLGMRGGASLAWPGKHGDDLIYERALTAPEILTLDAWMAAGAV